MINAQHSNKTYFHYTPLVWITRAIEVMGSIDTDPCTDDDAQFRPPHRHFAGEPNSVLWQGNVYCNPPGIRGLPRKFFEECVKYSSNYGEYSVIYLAYNIEQLVWIQDFPAEMDICIPRQRIDFLNKKGEPQGSPTHGNAFIYMGSNRAAFRRVFPGFHLLNHTTPY